MENLHTAAPLYRFQERAEHSGAFRSAWIRAQKRSEAPRSIQKLSEALRSTQKHKKTSNFMKNHEKSCKNHEKSWKYRSEPSPKKVAQHKKSGFFTGHGRFRRKNFEKFFFPEKKVKIFSCNSEKIRIPLRWISRPVEVICPKFERLTVDERHDA